MALLCLNDVSIKKHTIRPCAFLVRLEKGVNDSWSHYNAIRRITDSWSIFVITKFVGLYFFSFPKCFKFHKLIKKLTEAAANQLWQGPINWIHFAFLHFFFAWYNASYKYNSTLLKFTETVNVPSSAEKWLFSHAKYKQQRHRTGKSRSPTRNIVPERLAQRVGELIPSSHP